MSRPQPKSGSPRKRGGFGEHRESEARWESAVAHAEGVVAQELHRLGWEVTPSAAQGTALEKKGVAQTRTAIRREPVDVEDQGGKFAHVA